MDNSSVMDQLIRSLSFEVEAIPQDNILQLTTTSKSAPLNVKIRVRKKDEAGLQNGVLSLPKHNKPDNIPERIRLVSSDQTIMSFNVVMEADFQKPTKKPRKNILGIFKPTTCLGSQPDEDDYAYLPTTTYKADNVEENASKSESALTKFTLRKMDNNTETSNKLTRKKNKNIFGVCKPGGCLDPPFGEDKHPYSPAISNEQSATTANVAKVPEQIPEQVPEKKPGTCSKICNKRFKWKKKCPNNNKLLDENVIKKETKPEPVLNECQTGSLQPTESHSHSIITYPSTLPSSDPREEKRRGSRTYSKELKTPFDVHSGSYFMMPKKTKKVPDKKSKAEIMNHDDIGGARVDTANTKSEFKDITQHKDVEVYDNKNALQTKDSVTDVRSATGYIIETKDVKTCPDKLDSEEMLTPVEENQLSANKKTSDNFAPIFIPLLTKTDPIAPRNILTRKNEGSLKSYDDETDVLTTSPTNITSHKTADIEKIPLRLVQNKDKNIKDNMKNNETDVLTSSPTIKVSSDKPDYTEIILLHPTQYTDSEIKGTKNKEIGRLTSLSTKDLISDETDVLTSSPTIKVSSDKPDDTEIILLHPTQYTDSDIKGTKSKEIGSLTSLPTKDLISDKSIIEILPLRAVQNADTNEKDKDKTNEKDVLTTPTKNLIAEKPTDPKILSSLAVRKTDDKIKEGSKIKHKETDVLSSSSSNNTSITDNHPGTEILPLPLIQHLNKITKDEDFRNEIEKDVGTSSPTQTIFTNKPADIEILPLHASHSSNKIKDDTSSEKANQFLNTIPLTKKAVIDIPSEIKTDNFSHDIDQIMNDTNQIQNLKEVDENLLRKSIEESKYTDTVQNFIHSPQESKTSELQNQNRWHEEQKSTQIKNKAQPLTPFDSNNDTTNILGSINNSKLNTPSIQNKEYESKSPNKSILSISSQHEMSFFDIIDANSDSKKLLLGVRDEDATNITTPIKKATSQEIIQIGDDLQHIWKNTAKPLQSDTEMVPELEHSSQKYNITLDKVNGIKTYLDMKRPMSVLEKDSTYKDKKTDEIEKMYENSADLQSQIFDSKEISRTESIDEYGSNNENFSKTKDDLFLIEQAPAPPIIDKTVNKENFDSKQPERPLEGLPDFTQLNLLDKERLLSNITDDNAISEPSTQADNKINDITYHFEGKNNNDYNKLNRNQLNSKESISSIIVKQPESDRTQIEYPKPTYDIVNNISKEPDDTEHTAIHLIDRVTKNADKHIKKILKFDAEPIAGNDDVIAIKDSYSKPGFNLYSKANTNDEKVPLNKMMFPENIHSKADGKIINLALQCFKDETNQVHIKSFDPDIAPTRYPMDTVKVINRYVELDENIIIPIDSENDMYIQIKNKTQKGITTTGGYMWPDKTNKATTHVDDPIERNVTMADDIRRTLIAVYEDELLPLRNTISELKDNIVTLTSQQMLLKGHMLVKRPARTEAFFKKCPCMRR